jgi:hypothetical protein
LPVELFELPDADRGAGLPLGLFGLGVLFGAMGTFRAGRVREIAMRESGSESERNESYSNLTRLAARELATITVRGRDIPAFVLVSGIDHGNASEAGGRPR